MQYCVTKEEVDWIIRDWPVQWKLPVTKPTTRPVVTQSTKPKEKAEAGSSTKTNNPTDNTRKAAAQNQLSGSSAVPKIPRRTTTNDKEDNQQQTRKGDTSQAGEERVQVTTSGVQPSQTTRKPVQVEEGMQKEEVCHGRPSHHPDRG
jgi:hypothetical protein